MAHSMLGFLLALVAIVVPLIFAAAAIEYLSRKQRKARKQAVPNAGAVMPHPTDHLPF
jgi:cytochrome bd-type quinol oxidase subunit 2